MTPTAMMSWQFTRIDDDDDDDNAKKLANVVDSLVMQQRKKRRVMQRQYIHSNCHQQRESDVQH